MPQNGLSFINLACFWANIRLCLWFNKNIKKKKKNLACLIRTVTYCTVLLYFGKIFKPHRRSDYNTYTLYWGCQWWFFLFMPTILRLAQICIIFISLMNKLQAVLWSPVQTRFVSIVMLIFERSIKFLRNHWSLYQCSKLVFTFMVR